MEKNVLLTVEYDGAYFHGWQRQPDILTVQGLLEQVISKIMGKSITVEGTGRTDTGVHALGQCATFKCDLRIPIERLAEVINNGLIKATNSVNQLPPVRVLEARCVDLDFHARFNAVGKTYRYRIVNEECSVFERNYVYEVKEQLDLHLMLMAAKIIEGRHDFACFQNSGGTPRSSTVRTVYEVRVVENKPYIDILVTGDGFLYNMVRIIAGTLIDIGRGRLELHQLEEAINKADRTKAGHTAPPFGLTMKKVYFSENEMMEELNNV